MSKDLDPVFDRAHELGWTGKRQGDGSLRLLSPDGESTLHIPMKSKGVGNLARSLMRQLDRSLVPYVREELSERMGEQVEVLDVVSRDTAFGEFYEVQFTRGVEDFPQDESAKDEEEPVSAVALPSVVSEQPWMARVSSDGTTSDFYPSDVVTERVWSDGMKDYVCTVCNSFSSSKPRSVSAHGAWHTQRGEKAPTVATPTVFDLPVDGVLTHRRARLARELAAALKAVSWQGMKADELAEALAAHVIAARKERQDDAPESEPRTPEQMLASVQRIVSAPLVADLEETKAALVQHQEAVEAMKEADRKQREEFGALRDLVNAMTGGA